MSQEILGVFVARACSQGRGYGNVVMRALEDLARVKGRAEIDLSVSLHSKRFYEHLGNNVIEECSLDVGEAESLRFWKARKSLR